MHPQQPFAHAGSNIVDRIAGRRLLNLRQKKLLVFDEQAPECRKLVGGLANLIGRDHRRYACDLHHRLVERDLVVEGLSAPERTICDSGTIKGVRHENTRLGFHT
jgi:hypothetical protein